MSKPLSAGSTIETQCTRCRTLTNHTIVAMVGEKIVRVECNTCHSMHNYHPVKAAKEPAAARTTNIPHPIIDWPCKNAGVTVAVGLGFVCTGICVAVGGSMVGVSVGVRVGGPGVDVIVAGGVT